MRESAAGVAEAPDHLAVVQGLEYGCVVVDVAVESAGLNDLHGFEGLVVALGVEHGAGHQGCRGVAVHPSCSRRRLRQMFHRVAGVPFDGIPTLLQACSWRVFGVYGHLVEGVIEDDSQPVFGRGVAAHHHELDMSPEKENLGFDSGVLALAELRLVHVQVLESLVETAYPAVARCPAVEVVAADALLAGNGHNQVTVARTSHDATVFEYVGKAVGHVGIGASERTASELAPLGYHLVEVVYIKIGVCLAAHRIGYVVLVGRIEVHRTAGGEGERRGCKQSIIAVFHLFLLI